jgi:hypothetical protein
LLVNGNRVVLRDHDISRRGGTCISYPSFFALRLEQPFKQFSTGRFAKLLIESVLGGLSAILKFGEVISGLPVIRPEQGFIADKTGDCSDEGYSIPEVVCHAGLLVGSEDILLEYESHLRATLSSAPVNVLNTQENLTLSGWPFSVSVSQSFPCAGTA